MMMYRRRTRRRQRRSKRKRRRTKNLKRSVSKKRKSRKRRPKKSFLPFSFSSAQEEPAKSGFIETINPFKTTKGKVCSFKFTITKDALDSLRSYVIQDNENTVEHGGLFLNDGRSFNIDQSSVIPGTSSRTNVPTGRFSWHIHPKSRYNIEKVCKAWPSLPDYKALKSKMMDPSDNCIFHAVCGLEGLYTVSLTANAIRRGRSFIKSCKEELYKKVLPSGTFGFSNCHNLHLDYIREMKPKEPWDIQFFPWTTNPIIKVYFPSCDGKCNPVLCKKPDW